MGVTPLITIGEVHYDKVRHATHAPGEGLRKCGIL